MTSVVLGGFQSGNTQPQWSLLVVGDLDDLVDGVVS